MTKIFECKGTEIPVVISTFYRKTTKRTDYSLKFCAFGRKLLKHEKAPELLLRLFVIPSGFEPEAYCLEGSCSIQLSYGTDLLLPNMWAIPFKIGCKGSHFFANCKILHLKSYISAVVEGVVARDEAFRGPEFSDVERVVVLLLLQTLFALGECGAEKGVAVAGQHNLPWAEVEGDGDNLALGDGEAVDDGIGDVLIVHLLEH